MKDRVVLVWFRNDLRVQDHEALYRASMEADVVIPVFIIDPRHFEITKYGFTKTGPFRVKFLLESLKNLDKNLSLYGGRLIIRTGFPERIIPELVQEAGASKVYASREITQEELAVEKMVDENLVKLGVEGAWFWQSTLFHEADIPWPINRLPEVFTDFRKEAEKMAPVREVFPTPGKLNTPKDLISETLPSMDDLGIQPETTDPRAAMAFQGGEDAAWNRVNHYFWETDQLAHYKETRNGMLGADYSTKLSPWLALGCISPRSVYFEIKKYETERKKNSSTYWLFFELMWRDYFKFVAKKYGNKIFHLNGINGESAPEGDNSRFFEEWHKGTTEVPFVDANMQELLLTGFMSNRGRQNVASFWVNDLEQDWRKGAAWFEHRLTDYDPCSNWLNWAYVAGVGNDPRKDRYFNIESQAQRYDPKGHYTAHWLGPILSEK